MQLAVLVCRFPLNRCLCLAIIHYNCSVWKVAFPLRLIYFKFNGSGEAFERFVKFFTLDFLSPRKDNTMYHAYFLVKNLLEYQFESNSCVNFHRQWITTHTHTIIQIVIIFRDGIKKKVVNFSYSCNYSLSTFLYYPYFRTRYGRTIRAAKHCFRVLDMF